MAYQTVLATDTDDILNKFATFIAANMPSWTIDKNAVHNSNGVSGYWLCVHKTGETVYHTLHSNHNLIAGFDQVLTYLHTGFNGATDAYTQSGRATDNGNNQQNYSGDIPTIDLCHFFSDGVNYAYCAVRIATNLYTFFGFGQSLKQVVAANTTKDFCFATMWAYSGTNQDDPTNQDNGNIGHGSQLQPTKDSGMQSAYNDGVTTKFVTHVHDLATSPVNLIRGVRNTFTTGALYRNAIYSNTSFANNSSLIPILISANPTGGTGRMKPHIVIPDITWCRLDFYDVEDEIVVGSDTWKLFPWRQKHAFNKSEMYGYGIKKIP